MGDEQGGVVHLFGQTLSVAELRRRVGHLDQVAGIDALVLDDGSERGVRAMRVHNGSELSFIVLVDRGLDIGAAEFNGIPLAWLAPTGFTSAWYRDPVGTGLLHSFGGGLLVTCGPDNVGPPSEGPYGPVGLHGRFPNAPASLVTRELRWDETGGLLEIRGQVREAQLFGPNLLRRRRITIPVGQTRLRIEDDIVNEGFSAAPLLLLYHINFGWPLVDVGARVVGPGSAGAAPEARDAAAAAGLATLDRVDAPVPGFRERVFFHHPRPDAAGWATARIANPALAGGLCVTVRFRPEELPEFLQWTMTGEGMYVVGLEPSTCRAGGFQAEQAAGRVVSLAPGEARRYQLEIVVEQGAASATPTREPRE